MKTPLVLLHGFLGTAQDWDPTIEALGPDYRCLALNLPGHGRASEPVPADFESVIHGLAERIGKAFGMPVDLVGYSMGGRLALMLALLGLLIVADVALGRRITRSRPPPAQA